MNYVYLRPKTSGDPYTVGFYTPSGEWEPESDHNTSEEAAGRVNYLNGGKESGDEKWKVWARK